MSLRLNLNIVLLTLLICVLFAFENPILLDDLDYGNFTDGEVIAPVNGEYDFKAFSIKGLEAKNYTAKLMGNGHVQFVDDTGDRTINLIEWDKMPTEEKNAGKLSIDNELSKESRRVNGVDVHVIKFLISDNLYSAAVKDNSSDTLIYLSTPDEHETADIANSLRFK